MTTEEKQTRTNRITTDICLLMDIANMIRRDADALRNSALQEAAADEAERKMQKITGRGPTIYICGSKSYVEIPELMEFIKEEKRNFMQGTRPGYIEKKMGRRIAAEYALTKLQTLILRNELDKCRTPDEIRNMTGRQKTCFRAPACSTAHSTSFPPVPSIRRSGKFPCGTGSTKKNNR